MSRPSRRQIRTMPFKDTYKALQYWEKHQQTLSLRCVKRLGDRHWN